MSPNATTLADDVALLACNQNEGIGDIHHASGTRRLGREDHAMAVVDSKGRVFRVTGLCAIDTSSLRHTLQGPTQASTYAQADNLVTDIIRDAVSM